MTDGSTPPGGHGTGGRWPAWMTKPVVQIVVAVIAALAIAVLTPAGDWLREQLFPTKADVSGSVILGGQPAGVVQLMLDGEDVGSTNEQGVFLLEDVGDGEHTLTLETASPPAEGDHRFSVQQRATEVTLGAIVLNPLLELGYSATIQPRLGGFRYGITLWIHGDPEVMDRIRFVRYLLPAPLSGSVRRRNGARAFCYRSEGELSVLDATAGSGAVSAEVHLRDGESFQISAEKPGEDAPPRCPAGKSKQNTDGTDTDSTDTDGNTDTTDTDTTDTDTTPTPSTTLTLAADPDGGPSFDQIYLTAPAGEITIRLVNESGVPHNVEIEGQDAVSKTITEGSTKLTVMLEPGLYFFFCNIAGHRQAGMEGKLTVTP